MQFYFGQIKGLARIGDKNDGRMFKKCVHLMQSGHAVSSNERLLLKVKIVGDIPDLKKSETCLTIESLELRSLTDKHLKRSKVEIDNPEFVQDFSYPHFESAFPANKQLIARYDLEQLINLLTAIKDATGSTKNRPTLVDVYVDGTHSRTRPMLLVSQDETAEGLIVPCKLSQ